MKIKKILALTLSLMLSAVVLASCSNDEDSSSESSTTSATEQTEETTTTVEEEEPEADVSSKGDEYAEIIKAARSDEDNEYNKIITKIDSEDPLSGMMLEFFAEKPEDLESFAISMSVMNTRAYAVCIMKGVEGKEDAVLAKANEYVTSQKLNFENYLIDQYEVASAAKVEKLEDGTVVLVMCQDSDKVFESIKNSLK